MFRGQHLPCSSQLIRNGDSGLHRVVGSEKWRTWTTQENSSPWGKMAPCGFWLTVVHVSGFLANFITCGVRWCFEASRKWSVEKHTIVAVSCCRLSGCELLLERRGRGVYAVGSASSSQVSALKLTRSWSACVLTCSSEEEMARAGVKTGLNAHCSTTWMIADVDTSRIPRDSFIMTVALLFNSFVLANFPVPIPECQRRKQSRETF